MNTGVNTQVSGHVTIVTEVQESVNAKTSSDAALYICTPQNRKTDQQPGISRPKPPDFLEVRRIFGAGTPLR